MSTARWGVLGGTFDPIHYAHLAIAEQAREQLAADGIMFVPAAQTVHKPVTAVTPVEHRVAMVELAIADNQSFVLERLEVERGGASYTVDSMQALATARPRDELFFIVSAEAARLLPSWRRPERILELCRMAIVPRLGYETPDREWLAAQFPGQADRFTFIDAPALGHSASDIRRRVRAGRSIRYLVPAAVEAYIARHGLYRATADE